LDFHGGIEDIRLNCVRFVGNRVDRTANKGDGMKLLLKCPLCRTRRTSSGRCWRCKKRTPEDRKTYGTATAKRKPAKRVQSKARQWAHERAANQETKEDDIAMRLPIQARMESKPCRRCGRLVLVQEIPEEERRKLGSLPVAVECERPCAVRI
jgi:hypothetical protein